MIDLNSSRKLFNDQWDSISGKYVGLKIESHNSTPILSGTIDLVGLDGITDDQYKIEIHWRELYPFQFPLVYETGGRIPKNIDWHIYQEGGNCCIKARPEERLICRKGITLDTFITEQVIPYFYNQTFRRQNGYFYKERKHGEVGNLEFYFEKLRTNDIDFVELCLKQTTDFKGYKSTKKCFCGSNRKYKKCHRSRVRQLSQLGRSYIESDLTIIQRIKIAKVKLVF